MNKNVIVDDVCPSLNTLIRIISDSIMRIFNVINHNLEINTDNLYELIRNNSRNIEENSFEDNLKFRLTNILKLVNWNDLEIDDKIKLKKHLSKFDRSINKFNLLTDAGNTDTGDFNTLIYDYTYKYLEMIFPTNFDHTLSMDEKSKFILSSLIKRRSNLSQEYLEIFEIQKEITINSSKIRNGVDFKINGMPRNINSVLNLITRLLHKISDNNLELSPIGNPNLVIPYFDIADLVPSLQTDISSNLEILFNIMHIKKYTFPGRIEKYSFSEDFLEVFSAPEISLLEKQENNSKFTYKFRFSSNTLNQIYLTSIILNRHKLSRSMVITICVKIATFIYFKIINKLVKKNNIFYPIVKDQLFYEKFILYMAKLIAMILNSREWAGYFPFTSTNVKNLGLKSFTDTEFLDLSFLDGFLQFDEALDNSHWIELADDFDNILRPKISSMSKNYNNHYEINVQVFLNLFKENGLFKLIFIMKGEFLKLYLSEMIEKYFPWGETEHSILDQYIKLYYFDNQFRSELKFIVGNQFDIVESDDLIKLTEILEELQLIKYSSNKVSFAKKINPLIENNIEIFGLMRNGTIYKFQPTFQALINSNNLAIPISDLIILIQLTILSYNREDLSIVYYMHLAQRFIQFLYLKSVKEIASNHNLTKNLSLNEISNVLKEDLFDPCDVEDDKQVDFSEILMKLIALRISKENWLEVVENLLY
jgi:hypothetical protein